MAGNKVYRGPANKQARTVSKPVAAGLLPCTWVEETATQLVAITSAVDKNYLLLSNLEFKDQDLVTAYSSGDTGIAYEVEPGMVFQCAMAAATYTRNQPLTIGAAGRLVAAATGNRVVAYYDDVLTALAAGALADVIIADSYIKA